MSRLFMALLFGLGSALASAAPLPPPRAPSVDAQHYILLDFLSNQVIAESGADERADPASITKLMTAYVVFDALAQGLMQDTDRVTISRKAWKAIGSRMFAEVGTQVQISDLLHGLIIQSGNDAAIALAEHTAGSEESFADRMNQYAAKLGLSNTHYTNASGLTHPDHHTTARDIATLVQRLIADFPNRYAMYRQKEFSYNGITQRNRNRLLWRDDTVDGVKTGYTAAAGYCLATSAERDGMRLISVVLGAPSDNGRVSASEALLNWGFRFYESVAVGAAGAELERMRIYKGRQETLPLGRMEATWVVVPRGQADSIEVLAETTPQLRAPVQRGDAVGELVIRQQGRELRRLPLLGLEDVPLGSFWQRLRDETVLFVGG